MVIPDFRYFNTSDQGIIHYGVKRRSGRYPWGSGDRPFQSVNSSALSVYKNAIEREKTITKDIKDAAKESKSKLYGLENRLKTVDSIQRKINKKQIEDNKTEKESIESIHDSIRYTTISDTKDFVSSYESFKKFMERSGYTETKCKNYFNLFNQGVVKHKAVQSQFSTKDGFEFEVQFQTPESQDAKTKKIPLYEERRKVGIDSTRAKELENEMEKLALKVPDPPGIERIKSHSKEQIKHSQSEVKFKMNDFYYISHGGPGSGRYPLGSGDRPYQKFEKSRGGGGISGYIQSRKAKKLKSELEKRNKAAAKKKEEEQAKLRKLNEDRERLLMSGKASEILKYQGMWTNSELERIGKRLDAEKKLKDYSQSEIQSNMAKMDKIMNNLKTVNNWASIGTDTYNLMASIYNATPQGKQKPLTPVQKPQQGSGGGQPGKKKK